MARSKWTREVHVHLGTRKGGFILGSDDKRNNWQTDGSCHRSRSQSSKSHLCARLRCGLLPQRPRREDLDALKQKYAR